MPYTYTDWNNITDTSNTRRGCDPAVSKDALITRYSNVVDYCVYDDNCVDDGSDDYYYWSVDTTECGLPTISNIYVYPNPWEYNTIQLRPLNFH